MRIDALMAVYVVSTALASTIVGALRPEYAALSQAVLAAAPLATVLLASRKRGLPYLAPGMLLALVWAASLAGMGGGG